MKILYLISILLLLNSSFFACGPKVHEDEEAAQAPQINADDAKPIPVDTKLKCPQSTVLSYSNFAEDFFITHCIQCHSSNIKGKERLGAPDQYNFDQYTQVLSWRMNILASVSSGKMPPKNVLNDKEKLLLKEWIECGSPE